MRVLYIDQYFSTRAGISGTRGYEFARRMINKGHEVTVITSSSRYGSFFPQKEYFRHQDVEGIKVISIRIAYHQLMSFPRRAWSFAVFMLAAAFFGVIQKRHDIVFATSTPLSIGFPGLLVSLVRGTPLVFEVRDLWPRAPMELGIITNNFLLGFLRSFEKLVYKLSTHVVALSPGMRDGIIQAGSPLEKITVIPNAADLDLFNGLPPKNSLRKELGIEDHFTLVYAGTVGVSNNLGYLVDVAAKLKPQVAKDLRFLVIGEGNDLQRVMDYAKSKGITNIKFIDAMGRKKVARYLAASDFGLTLFKDVPVLATNSPNKFFDYLAAGLPCAINTDGWTTRLLKDKHAGIFLPPKDPAAGARAIEEIYFNKSDAAKMGKNALQLARTDFERGKLLDELMGTFDKARRKKSWGLEYFIKGVFDFFMAALSLFILSPIIFLIAAAIKFDSKGPVFYKQKRAGKNGRSFSVFKFRTMVKNADKMGLGLNIKENDNRITKVGEHLRDWSLDELPQLINILFLQMSLIGPRPALLEQVDKYTALQRKRLELKPGLTGLSQVSGRNSLSWKKRIELDVQYVRDFSLYQDIKIFLRTFHVVLSKEGLYEKGAGLEDDMNRDL